MAAVKTEFTEFIAADLAKYEGIRVPLKASLFERTFKRWTRCNNLHPNPDDEFSMPDIGPSYEIISGYERRMREEMSHGNKAWDVVDERLMVEKMHPEGYMLINGHHRWAAALRIGVKRAPIKILNLTHEEDIVNILENSKNDKRVTIDLDELIFVNDTDITAEKELPFPANRRFKERIRLGFPALCRFLHSKGYDIWVFTSDFYSVDYIEALFTRYHVKVDGILTATGKLKNVPDAKMKRIKEMVNRKYTRTLNLYNDMILVIDSNSSDYEQLEIKGTAQEWIKEVENRISGLDDK